MRNVCRGVGDADESAGSALQGIGKQAAGEGLRKFEAIRPRRKEESRVTHGEQKTQKMLEMGGKNR
ncbi:MAG: hypothetical protein A4E67_00342 [Syntrophaceae bacterium PtaB.Bin038]|nr:MAG: hypothetical protein A4E67_00342 [Syntrophaceae bacterium PtaB.Bin038]